MVLMSKVPSSRNITDIDPNIMWEHFHHQADIGIRGMGETAADAFEQAALALMAVICQPGNVVCKERVQINCQGDDLELLFIDFINAIIYEISTRTMVFGRFEVVIDGDKLSAKAWGEKIDPEKHETATEVKAATYMCLSVSQNDSGEWAAQCVVDV